MIKKMNKKKQTLPELLGLNKEIYEKLLTDDIQVLEAAADALEALVKGFVIKALKVQGIDPKTLPLTDTVRLRLQSQFDERYLLVGLPRTGPRVPDAGLIRLSEADSLFIYYLLCCYRRKLRDTRLMADMAGQDYVEPDLYPVLTDQPGKRLERYDGDNVYHPMEPGFIMFLRDV